MYSALEVSNPNGYQLCPKLVELHNHFDQFRKISVNESNENKILEHYCVLKSNFWFHLLKLHNQTQILHYSDIKHYQFTIQQFNELVFKVIDVCNHFTKDKRATESITFFFTELKLKIYYIYLLNTYSLKKIPALGIWDAIHNLFFEAYRLKKVNTFHNKYYSIINSHYKKMLLLFFFQPYNLSAKEYESLTIHIDKYAKVLKIISNPSEEKVDLIIAPNLDLPFIRADQYKRMNTVDQLFSLETNLLQYFIKFICTYYTFHEDNIKTMTLKKLLNNWNSGNKREFERSLSHDNCRCFLSFKDIWFSLKHHYENTLEPGFVANTSKKGICVKFPGIIPTQPSNLIYINGEEYLNQNVLGVVRWVQEKQDEMLVGIEFITSQIKPISIYVDELFHDKPILGMHFDYDKNKALLSIIIISEYPIKRGMTMQIHGLDKSYHSYRVIDQTIMGSYRVCILKSDILKNKELH